MSDSSSAKARMWCPCCNKVRLHQNVSGLRPGVRRLSELFEGLEVEGRPDDPQVFARTRRCDCSAEWGSVEVPTHFLFRLLDERRLYQEARQVAQAILDHARAVEETARALEATQALNAQSLKVTIDEAEAQLESLNARSDKYFLR